MQVSPRITQTALCIDSRNPAPRIIRIFTHQVQRCIYRTFRKFFLIPLHSSRQIHFFFKFSILCIHLQILQIFPFSFTLIFTLFSFYIFYSSIFKNITFCQHFFIFYFTFTFTFYYF